MNETYYDRDCLEWLHNANGAFVCQDHRPSAFGGVLDYADLQETRGPLFTSVAAWEAWNYGGGVQ